MRLLVAEDERDLNAIISKTLKKNHYSVDSCYDGQEALDFLETAEYDAVILDIMMPKVSGLAVLKSLRAAKRRVPVLLLTARDSVADRVAGLDAGADDYLVKPFSFDELLARIRAMTRKSAGAATSAFTCGDLTLDEASHTVTRAGQKIELSAKEFGVLDCLIRNKGSVLSRETIENNVWNYDWEGGTNVVDVYMSYLRRKVDSGFEKKLIHTVRGVGWVLREE